MFSRWPYLSRRFTFLANVAFISQSLLFASNELEKVQFFELELFCFTSASFCLSSSSRSLKKMA